MAGRRAAVTVSVERELLTPDGAPERVRLSAVIEGAPGSETGPNLDELRAGLARIRSELDALSEGTRPPVVPPRGLEELVETYRPRQEELVALLESEREITFAEATLLRSYLAGTAGPPASPARAGPPVPPPQDRPIAAAPLEHDRTPTVPRPVPTLLSVYRIESLKQAGAVRARRQISFEEYMALKRHFSATPEAAPTPELPAVPAARDPP